MPLQGTAGLILFPYTISMGIDEVRSGDISFGIIIVGSDPKEHI